MGQKSLFSEASHKNDERKTAQLFLREDDKCSPREGYALSNPPKFAKLSLHAGKFWHREMGQL